MLSAGLLSNQHYGGVRQPKENGHTQEETNRKEETKRNNQHAFKSHHSYTRC